MAPTGLLLVNKLLNEIILVYFFSAAIKFIDQREEAQKSCLLLPPGSLEEDPAETEYFLCCIAVKVAKFPPRRTGAASPGWGAWRSL